MCQALGSTLQIQRRKPRNENREQPKLSEGQRQHRGQSDQVCLGPDRALGRLYEKVPDNTLPSQQYHLSKELQRYTSSLRNTNMAAWTSQQAMYLSHKKAHQDLRVDKTELLK